MRKNSGNQIIEKTKITIPEQSRLLNHIGERAQSQQSINKIDSQELYNQLLQQKQQEL